MNVIAKDYLEIKLRFLSQINSITQQCSEFEAYLNIQLHSQSAAPVSSPATPVAASRTPKCAIKSTIATTRPTRQTAPIQQHLHLMPVSQFKLFYSPYPIVVNHEHKTFPTKNL